MVPISILSILFSFDFFSQIVSPLYESPWISDLFHQYCSTASFASIDQFSFANLPFLNCWHLFMLIYQVKIFGAVV